MKTLNIAKIAPSQITIRETWERIDVNVINHTNNQILEDVNIPYISFGSWNNGTAYNIFDSVVGKKDIKNVIVAYRVTETRRDIWVADLMVDGTTIDINRLDKYSIIFQEGGYRLFKNDTPVTEAGEVFEFIQPNLSGLVEDLKIKPLDYFVSIHPTLKNVGWSAAKNKLFAYSFPEVRELASFYLQMDCENLALQALVGNSHLYSETIEAMLPELNCCGRLKDRIAGLTPRTESKFNQMLLNLIRLARADGDDCVADFVKFIDLYLVRPEIEDLPLESAQDLRNLSAVAYYAGYIQPGEWDKYSLEELCEVLVHRSNKDLFW